MKKEIYRLVFAEKLHKRIFLAGEEAKGPEGEKPAEKPSAGKTPEGMSKERAQGEVNFLFHQNIQKLKGDEKNPGYAGLSAELQTAKALTDKALAENTGEYERVLEIAQAMVGVTLEINGAQRRLPLIQVKPDSFAENINDLLFAKETRTSMRIYGGRLNKNIPAQLQPRVNALLGRMEAVDKIASQKEKMLTDYGQNEINKTDKIFEKINGKSNEPEPVNEETLDPFMNAGEKGKGSSGIDILRLASNNLRNLKALQVGLQEAPEMVDASIQSLKDTWLPQIAERIAKLETFCQEESNSLQESKPSMHERWGNYAKLRDQLERAKTAGDEAEVKKLTALVTTEDNFFEGEIMRDTNNGRKELSALQQRIAVAKTPDLADIQALKDAADRLELRREVALAKGKPTGLVDAEIKSLQQFTHMAELRFEKSVPADKADQYKEYESLTAEKKVLDEKKVPLTETESERLSEINSRLRKLAPELQIAGWQINTNNIIKDIMGKKPDPKDFVRLAEAGKVLERYLQQNGVENRDDPDTKAVQASLETLREAQSVVMREQTSESTQEWWEKFLVLEKNLFDARKAVADCIGEFKKLDRDREEKRKSIGISQADILADPELNARYDKLIAQRGMLEKKLRDAEAALSGKVVDEPFSLEGKLMAGEAEVDKGKKPV